MWGRRLVYGTVLLGCLVFYWAYREWLAWFLLVLALAVPWFSLLCSLPAMRKVSVVGVSQRTVTKGEQTYGALRFRCPLPMPPVRGKLRLESALTGQRKNWEMGKPLPTAHCTRLVLTARKAWVYDYLGLFRIKLSRIEAGSLFVRPVPVPMEEPADLERYRDSAWKPKTGGGFAENHELRLYRPGDSLNLVHWKLTAKTGKLMLREPMEPIRGKALLTVVLSGSRAEIDEKLGRLLWLSGHLLQRELPHEINCYTGRGMERFLVASETEMYHAIDGILCAPMTQEDGNIQFPAAAWHCHIGGNADEG